MRDALTRALRWLAQFLPATKRRYWRLAAQVGVPCAFVVVLGACSSVVDPVVTTFNNAIDRLQNQSEDWQKTLQGLHSQLVQEGQSSLANEVQGVLNRGIAAGSMEARCDTQFVGSELAQALQNILAKYRHQSPPGEPPKICSVDPVAIDLGLSPDRRGTLNIYGFNFSEDTINVSVVDKSGSRRNPGPGTFSVPSEFLATLNIRNYPFTATSKYVIFTLKGGEPGTVGIIHASACGGVGQPCCSESPCSDGLGCLGGICTTCPGPQEEGRITFERDDFAGNNLGGVNEDRTYAGVCDNGFQRDGLAESHLQITGTCDKCTATARWTSPAANDCRLTVHFHTPGDLFKGVHVHIKMTESKPIPQGCPSP